MDELNVAQACWEALHEGDLALFVSLLKANPEIIFEQGSSFLYIAIDNACLRFVATLLIYGVNPGLPVQQGTACQELFSPLYLAVTKDDYAAIELLIRFGADPHEKIQGLPSLLDIAYKERAARSVMALLTYDVKLDSCEAYHTKLRARAWFRRILSLLPWYYTRDLPDEEDDIELADPFEVTGWSEENNADTETESSRAKEVF